MKKEMTQEEFDHIIDTKQPFVERLMNELIDLSTAYKNDLDASNFCAVCIAFISRVAYEISPDYKETALDFKSLIDDSIKTLERLEPK